jgi:hypothetical protein
MSNSQSEDTTLGKRKRLDIEVDEGEEVEQKLQELNNVLNLVDLPEDLIKYVKLFHKMEEICIAVLEMKKVKERSLNEEDTICKMIELLEGFALVLLKQKLKKIENEQFKETFTIYIKGLEKQLHEVPMKDSLQRISVILCFIGKCVEEVEVGTEESKLISRIRRSISEESESESEE